MDLNREHVIIKIEDAEFHFEDCGISAYFDIEELREKKDAKGLIEKVKELLVDVKNLTYKGEPMSIEQFKDFDIPASLAFALLKKYADAVGASITAEAVATAEKETKNAQ